MTMQPYSKLPAVFFPSRRWPSLACAFALTLALLGSVLAASRPDAEPPDEVRTVVQMQLQAVAADDASRAFDLNDAEVRSQFGDAEDFMTMLRNEYPMVRSPSKVEFLRPEADGSHAYQRVRLTDAEGGLWTLTYVLSLQPDHQWRISACLVTPERAPVLV